MKKINKYFMAGLVGLLATTSCKKLELNPANQIAIGQAFQSVKDAQSWDTGVYGTFRDKQYGYYTFFSDVQADQLNATLDFGNRNGSSHRWDFQNDDQTLQPIWAGYYNGLANVNAAIAGFKTITPTSAAETAQLNQYTADLYFARAFYYHKLVTRFAKPYEAATAATDLGVPLVVTFDLYLQPARASVKAVYDQILADIATAKTLYSSVVAYNTSLATTAGTTAANNLNGKQGATTFTLDAATALEARVRLYMHDNAGAYTAANSLITGNKYPLITTEAALKTYWYNDGVTETILQSAVSLTELPRTNNIYFAYSTGNAAYDPDFLPTKGVYDLFPVGDIRKTTYFSNLNVKIGGIAATVQLVGKYPGNPALYSGAVTASNFAQAPKVFRIGEMYAIAAEAAQGAGSDGNALIALNALRVARGEVALVGVAGATLTTAIRDERTRELAFEGFRLDDLERWHVGFTRLTPQNTALIYTGALYDSLTQPADANKFVWGIPTNDIVINKNLVQNPGW